MAAGLARLGHANALGTTAGATTVAAAATLDLNGLTVPENLTINGAGVGSTAATIVAAPNSLGALINTSTAADATLNGNLALASSASIGNNTYGTSLPASAAFAGVTPVPGDITLAGTLSGLTFTLTKTGNNTVFFNNATAASNTVGAVQVNYGTFVINGSGSLSAASATANVLSPGGTLLLDNSTTPISQRLGNRGLYFNGNLVVTGNATTPVVETISALTNNFNLSAGSVLTLNPNGGTGGVTVGVNTPTTATTVFSHNQGGTLLIQGLTNTVTGGIFQAGGTALYTGGDIIGQQSSATAGATPTVGTLNKGIIPFIIVDQDAGGTGTRFATTATTSTTGNLASLQASEMLTDVLPTTVSRTVNWQSATTFFVNDATGLATGQSVSGVGIGAGLTDIISAIAAAPTASGTLVTITGNGATQSGATNLVFSAGAAGVGSAGIANLNLTSATPVTTVANVGTLVNSLTFSNSNSPVLSIPAGSALEIASGGILAAGNASITGGGILQSEFTAGTQFAPTAFGREMIFHVTAGNTLSVAPVIFGTGGLTKADGGALTLSSQETYVGQTTINGGTLQLAGIPNTIFMPYTLFTNGNGSSTSTPSGQVFQVNLGGTLDLNGANQAVGNFSSQGQGSGGVITNSSLPFTGGSIVNSAATGATLPASYPTFRIGDTGNTSWGGNIGGSAAGSLQKLNFQRDGNSTFTVVSRNQFTGSATITGGATTLIDLGTFENITALNITRSGLIWNDTGAAAIGNRLPANVPITLNSGGLQIISRPGTNAVYNLTGAITLASGDNDLRPEPAGGTLTLNLGSFRHPCGQSRPRGDA